MIGKVSINVIVYKNALNNVQICTGMYMGHVKEMIDCYVDFLFMMVA